MTGAQPAGRCRPRGGQPPPPRPSRRCRPTGGMPRRASGTPSSVAPAPAARVAHRVSLPARRGGSRRGGAGRVRQGVLAPGVVPRGAAVRRLVHAHPDQRMPGPDQGADAPGAMAGADGRDRAGGAGGARISTRAGRRQRAVAGGSAARTRAAARRSPRRCAKLPERQRSVFMLSHVEGLHVAGSQRADGVERVDRPRAPVPGDPQAADAAGGDGIAARRQGLKGETPCHFLIASGAAASGRSRQFAAICGRDRRCAIRISTHCADVPRRFDEFDGVARRRRDDAARRGRRASSPPNGWRRSRRRSPAASKRSSVRRGSSPFPKAARAVISGHSHVRRWVAVAAAAGLIAGVGLGQVDGPAPSSLERPRRRAAPSVTASGRNAARQRHARRVRSALDARRRVPRLTRRLRAPARRRTSAPSTT